MDLFVCILEKLGWDKGFASVVVVSSVGSRCANGRAEGCHCTCVFVVKDTFLCQYRVLVSDESQEYRNSKVSPLLKDDHTDPVGQYHRTLQTQKVVQPSMQV